MNIKTLTPKDIVSVYSGKAHRCCCGCAGIHRYNSAHIKIAGKRRGYKIDTEEINDRHVSKVLRIIQNNPQSEYDSGPHCRLVSLEIGNKLYIAYLL